jgi:hypothetical protein
MGRHRNYGGAGPSIPFPEDAMLQISKTLHPSDILNLFALPFTLIPTPGPQKVIVPFGWCLSLNFNTTPYAAGGDLFISFGAGSHSFNDQVGSGLLMINAASAIAEGTIYPLVNDPAAGVNDRDKPLILSNAGAPFINGDSDLLITIFFSVAPTL